MLGVPPPQNTVWTGIPGCCFPTEAISIHSACIYAGINVSIPAYVLKAQYVQICRQNGT